MKEFFYLVAMDQKKGILISLLKILLWMFSIIFWGAISIRGLFYKLGVFKSDQLSKPVISVGNITVGGSGKTPLVQWIAKQLKKQERKPAVLIRGYMDKKVQETAAQVPFSDEAELLRDSLKDTPILVGPNRIENAKKALKEKDVDVFILDDGFQHRQLSRNLDVVVIDTTNPFGNGHLIPRGILREPISSLLRAHVIVLTKTDLDQKRVEDIKGLLKTFCPDVPVVETIHKPTELIDLCSNKSSDVSSIKGKDIYVVSSIGNPIAFERTLENLGANLKKKISFMDHYLYNKEDIERLINDCRINSINTIITTQKDAVKLQEFKSLFEGQIEVLVLRIEISITHGKDQFLERITSVLQR